MQEQEKEKKPRRLRRPSGGEILILLWRARLHPKAAEPFIRFLKSSGASEKEIVYIKEVLAVGREARRDDETFHRIDNYLVGGIGVIDLLLFQIILPIGTPDLPLSIALLALIVSLPLVSSSLFFSFLKKKYEIMAYGKIHSVLSTLSLLTGIIALTATIWHDSHLHGIVFLCIAIGIYILCTIYAAIIVFKKQWEPKISELHKIIEADASTSDNTKEHSN